MLTSDWGEGTAANLSRSGQRITDFVWVPKIRQNYLSPAAVMFTVGAATAIQ